MDIKQLRIFVTLAECLSFTRTSRRVHMSPSTLTRAIAHMETQLGTALFERDNRHVSLTPAGAIFLQYARESLQQWELLQNNLMAESGRLRGEISVYCSVTASYSFLYDILANFRQFHPEISLLLHTGDPAQALDRISQGLEDVAITAKPHAMPLGIVFKRITQSPLLLITALEDNNTYQSEDWPSLPLILPEQGVARHWMEDWLTGHKITPKIQAQVAGHEAIVSMVSLGFGIGLAPKIVVDNSPLAGKVKPCRLQPRLPPYEVGVCVQEKRLRSPLVQAFWSQI